MEELYVYSLLYMIEENFIDDYRNSLNKLFLKESNDILLDLQGRNYKDAMLHLYSMFKNSQFNSETFGKYLMEKINIIYHNTDIYTFAAKMVKLWNLLPNPLYLTEPFHTFSYADECLDYNDEKQCRELYEKAINYYA